MTLGFQNYNLISNMKTLKKIFNWREWSVLFVNLLAIFFLMIAVLADFFSHTLSLFTLLHSVLAGYMLLFLRTWYTQKKLEATMKTLLQENMATFTELFLEKETLLKLLQKIDQRVLQRSGVHLSIQNEKEKPLSN